MVWVKGFGERLRMLLLGLTKILANVVADKTVAVSANTRRWLPWVRSVVPNGVDLGRFRPGERSLRPSLLFVGTYLQLKRGKLLNEAFEREVLPTLPYAELWMVRETPLCCRASRLSAVSRTRSSRSCAGAPGRAASKHIRGFRNPLYRGDGLRLPGRAHAEFVCG